MVAIVAIVERGKADYIVKRAKKAGAHGATILYGRGTGETEAKMFLKIHIESSKEIIIVITDQVGFDAIFEEMIRAGKLKEPGTGVIFSVPISNLVGLSHRDNFTEK